MTFWPGFILKKKDLLSRRVLNQSGKLAEFAPREK